MKLDDRNATQTDPFLKRVAELERDLATTMPTVSDDPDSHHRTAKLIAEQERMIANRNARAGRIADGVLRRTA